MEVAKVFSFVCLLAAGSVLAQIDDFTATQKTIACLQKDPMIQTELKQCYEKKFMGVPQSGDKPGIETTIRQVCAMVDPTSCISDHIIHYKKCIDEEQAEALEKALNILRAGYNYACDDDGAKIKEFIDAKGLECVQKLFILTPQHERMECMQESVKSAELELNKTKGDKEKQEEIGCVTLLKLKDCTLTAMECSDERPVELLEGLIRAMLKESACWKYVASGSSALVQEMYFSTMIAVFVLTFSN